MDRRKRNIHKLDQGWMNLVLTSDLQTHGKGAVMRDHAAAMFISAGSSYHPYMQVQTQKLLEAYQNV